MRTTWRRPLCATQLRFDRPVYCYVENFRGFPVGVPVPVGSYARQVFEFLYDSVGRSSRDVTPEGLFQYAWQANGLLAGVTAPDGSRTSYTYDGPVPLQETFTGPVPGSMSLTYDNDTQVRSHVVAGTAPVTFDYDADGLMVRAGELNIAADAASGRLTGTSLGGTGDSWSYDAFGQPVAYSVPGVLSLTWVRYALGRVTEQTETVQGESHTWHYRYPSWVLKEAPPPLAGEDGKTYARRIMDERYPSGAYPKGPKTEYQQLQKWVDRSWEKP